MIIGEVYSADNNKALKVAQHETYSHNIVAIFEMARSEFVRADAILNAQLLIAETAESINKFDHRVLQDAHDIMAAAYRYRCDDGGQLRLWPEGGERSRYGPQWNRWFTLELEKIIKNPSFVRAVVEAVVFSNTELGYMAEHRMCQFLVAYYEMERWAYPHHYVRLYAEDKTPS